MSMEGMLGQILDGMKEMKQDFQGLKQDVQVLDTRESVATIEVVHGQKIGALFDLCSRTHDVVVEVQTKAHKHEGRLNEHAARLFELALERARGSVGDVA